MISPNTFYLPNNMFIIDKVWSLSSIGVYDEVDLEVVREIYQIDSLGGVDILSKLKEIIPEFWY